MKWSNISFPDQLGLLMIKRFLARDKSNFQVRALAVVLENFKNLW